MKVILALLLGLLAFNAYALISCGQDGYDCDGPFVITDESAPYDSVPAELPIFADTDVEVTNQTIAELLLAEEDKEQDAAPMLGGALGERGGGKAVWEIGVSVKEMNDWINSGGSNPLEAGLIRKVLTFLNSAGVSIQSGSLVYQLKNGHPTELQPGCTDVMLLGGWQARASLKPGFQVKLSFGVNTNSLVVGSVVTADCDFAMAGGIRARFGSKVGKGCMRLIVKRERVTIGAYMRMNVISRLELLPNLTIDPKGNAVISLAPKYQLRGDLLDFKPFGTVSIKIFGIHIGFIERLVANAIRTGIKKAFNQRTIDEQFAAATMKVQLQLEGVLKLAVVKIPLVPPTMQPKLKSAITNIRAKQAINM